MEIQSSGLSTLQIKRFLSKFKSPQLTLDCRNEANLFRFCNWQGVDSDISQIIKNTWKSYITANDSMVSNSSSTLTYYIWCCAACEKRIDLVDVQSYCGCCNSYLWRINLACAEFPWLVVRYILINQTITITLVAQSHTIMFCRLWKDRPSVCQEVRITKKKLSLFPRENMFSHCISSSCPQWQPEGSAFIESLNKLSDVSKQLCDQMDWNVLFYQVISAVTSQQT